jgi:hypothetical protein
VAYSFVGLSEHVKSIMFLLLERTSFSKACLIIIRGELITRLVPTLRLFILVFFINNPLF